MQKKQGILLYLKQWASQHGTLSSECYQLARAGEISEKEMQKAIGAGLDLYEARRKIYAFKEAA